MGVLFFCLDRAWLPLQREIYAQQPMRNRTAPQSAPAHATAAGVPPGVEGRSRCSRRAWPQVRVAEAALAEVAEAEDHASCGAWGRCLAVGKASHISMRRTSMTRRPSPSATSTDSLSSEHRSKLGGMLCNRMCNKIKHNDVTSFRSLVVWLCCTLIQYLRESWYFFPSVCHGFLLTLGLLSTKRS